MTLIYRRKQYGGIRFSRYSQDSEHLTNFHILDELIKNIYNIMRGLQQIEGKLYITEQNETQTALYMPHNSK